MGEINDLGGISLSLFLGMAMITLKLWELASLALPLVILLAAQTLLIGVFTYFVIFRIMGHDYDAAFSPPVLVDLVWEQPQMPGKYAGLMRPLCAIGKSLSADSTGRKSVSSDSSVDYDNLAIPEVHIKGRK